MKTLIISASMKNHFLKFERVMFQHLEKFPLSYKTFLTSTPSWINEKLRIVKTIKKKLKYKKPILFIEHHMAHAASAFLVSPFKKAAILTIDGVGEWTTTAIGLGENEEITLLKEIKFPHSIGLLYSTITAYLGMSVNNSEYKCLHPDTNILLSNGNLLRIEELFNLEGKKKKLSDTEEILKLKSEIELFSLDKNTLKLIPNKTNIVYRKKADTYLYEVELFSGKKATVTSNHKFTSVSPFGDIFSIEAKDLKKKDFILVAKDIRHKPNSNKKYMYWAKLLAYSIAEGHELIRKEKNEAEIRIGIVDNLLMEDIKKTVEKLNKTYRTWEIKDREKLLCIGISVWKDLDLLEKMGHEFGKRAGSKCIPKLVFLSDKSIQKEFLSTLFDCDGSFLGHQIIYSTKSETLANQVVYILLNFGIHSRLRKILNKKYNRYYYRIEINGKYLREFYSNVGFNLKIKNKKLKNYINSINKFGNQVKFIPINDYVLNEWIASGRGKTQLYKQIGYHFWDYETKKRYVTTPMLRKVDNLLKNEKIRKFVESDVFFDRIKGIRKIRFNGYVYDVLMPNHHTFIGGVGGIVLHNTMGLSAYGNMDKTTNPYYQKLKKVLELKEDGSYQFDMSYFVYHYKDRMPSKKLCKLLGGKIRKNEEINQRHKDLAAALQLLTEEVIFKILNHIYKITKCDNIVLAGGVALNSVCNGKILRNTNFKNIWIQPNSSDGGTSLGVASYIYNVVLGNKRNFELKDAYLGPEYSDNNIKNFLDSNKIKYLQFKDKKDLIGTTARLIYENNVIGWFQGRMEWGPRALGSRSILSNPCNPEMQNILNLKVKHRENFRPFAPVVCEDDALKYFDCDVPIQEPTDYMLMVYPIKKEYHKKIPAVTHIDGSGRLQTIRKTQNLDYYNLIKEFGKLSKIPILINTSFNIRGEPIVCTPQNAYRCMMGTGIDYLVIGNFLIKRSDNPKDMWNSEKYAKD